ncbi:MAG: rhodanese-like domain-containing protein [Desulfobulbaceae bacterium]|nr:rhodanese-like domain-containing protein [Desulfobulbaceae bacterium]
MTTGEKWKAIRVRKIPPKNFQKILKEEKDLFILDVRSLDKRTLSQQDFDFTFDNAMLSGNYIKGVMHCPLILLEDNYRLIPKDKKIIITDWIMKQSTIAAKFLIMKGYDVVGILKGGTARWQAEGYPLIEGKNSLHNELLCD